AIPLRPPPLAFAERRYLLPQATDRILRAPVQGSTEQIGYPPTQRVPFQLPFGVGEAWDGRTAQWFLLAARSPRLGSSHSRTQYAACAPFPAPRWLQCYR